MTSFVKVFHQQKGVTLVELTVATLLLSTVFLGAASLYVSGLKFINGAQADTSQVESTTAAEEITKRISLANYGYIGDYFNGNSGRSLFLRGDYKLGTYVPNNTPEDLSDDTWVKFRFIGGNLHWRRDTAANALVNVSSADPALLSNLQTGSSYFMIPDPTTEGNKTVIRIRLATQHGPGNVELLLTDAHFGAMAKR